MTLGLAGTTFSQRANLVILLVGVRCKNEPPGYRGIPRVTRFSKVARACSVRSAVYGRHRLTNRGRVRAAPVFADDRGRSEILCWPRAPATIHLVVKRPRLCGTGKWPSSARK